MSIAKKHASENWEEAGSRTTRNTSRHGLTKGQKRAKRRANKAGRKFEARLVFAEQI